MSEANEVERVVMCCATQDVQKFLNESLDAWEQWKIVLATETWDDFSKTREQVINLCGYFEGRYDTALKLKKYYSQESRKA